MTELEQAQQKIRDLEGQVTRLATALVADEVYGLRGEDGTVQILPVGAHEDTFKVLHGGFKKGTLVKRKAGPWEDVA